MALWEVPRSIPTEGGGRREGCGDEAAKEIGEVEVQRRDREVSKKKRKKEKRDKNASPVTNLKRDYFRSILITVLFWQRTVSLAALGAAEDATRKTGRTGKD